MKALFILKNKGTLKLVFDSIRKMDVDFKIVFKSKYSLTINSFWQVRDLAIGPFQHY